MAKQASLFKPKNRPSRPKTMKPNKPVTRKKVKSMTEEQLEIIRLIEKRRRQILVHSYIYYDMDDNFISDFEFDYFCVDLVELQEKYPGLSKIAERYTIFKDFTGATGHDLPYREDWIMRVYEGLVRYRKRKQKEGVTEVYSNDSTQQKREDDTNAPRIKQTRKPSGPKLRSKKTT